MSKELSRREQARQLKQYRDWMLQHKSTRYVVDKIFTAALDDEHKNQAVAWKLIMDRVAPLAGFSAEQKANNAIQIHITGLDNASVDQKTVLNGDFDEVTDDGEP